MADPGRETEFTQSSVIEVFETREDYAEPLTATEIADRLGCSRRTALNRLHDLEDETDVTSKKVGGRSRVWWIPVPVDG
jgi:MarR-like DNA-binding transcriptional regulator SgrR of sgrS sRNA